MCDGSTIFRHWPFSSNPACSVAEVARQCRAEQQSQTLSVAISLGARWKASAVGHAEQLLLTRTAQVRV